jgi:phenylacetate-CoA ligase
LDPKTFAPVKPGEPGEIVITPLEKRHMPLIRLRLGDLGRRLASRCPCGRTEPLFELLGRCDDRIHLGGAHLFASDIQDAVSATAGLSRDFQAIVFKKGPKDALKIRVQARPGTASGKREGLAKRLSARLRESCEDLARSLESGLLGEPEIEILPPGAIERVARTGKLRRVVDRRPA